MFSYKKAEFEFDNVSFALPKGLLLDTANIELILDGFHLVSPDDSFEIEISCYNSKQNAYRSLSDLISKEVGYILIGEIESISYGGLDGYMCRYYNRTTVNEEYAFDIPNGTEYTRMNIFITASKHTPPYDEAFKQKVVSEILQSIAKK